MNLPELMTKMAIESKREDRAFMSPAMPVNAIPFLNRMIELVRLHGNDAQRSWEFMANLHVVMGMTFGQLATIDLNELYLDLQNHYINEISNQ